MIERPGCYTGERMGLHKKIWIAVCLTAVFLVAGTIGYVRLEGFTLLEAFYMTVITISTVGFGEINELTNVGRIFTVFLILLGVGSVAFAAHSFTESLIEKASNPNSRKKAMKKRIDKLRDHCIICGHGRVGAAAASYFKEMGAGFVVIESSETELRFLEEEGYLTVSGDATSEKTLLSAGIKKADALLALLDSDPENLFTVLTARELNPTLKIIARTEVASSENRILRAGADSVISPYASAGKRVADKILKSNLEENLEETDLFRKRLGVWHNVSKQPELQGKTVGEAESKIGAQIIGLRRSLKDVLLPDALMQIERGDQLLLAEISQELNIERKNKGAKTLVLIDDNPVIRRLYTRLFQKAGYSITTAENGKEGLAKITQEMPDAAVIDYMLPDITGLDVCRELKNMEDDCQTKLVLFTANDQEDTKERALQVGVERVVVKSPEASEIISIVEEILATEKGG